MNLAREKEESRKFIYVYLRLETKDLLFTRGFSSGCPRGEVEKMLVQVVKR